MIKNYITTLFEKKRKVKGHKGNYTVGPSSLIRHIHSPHIQLDFRPSIVLQLGLIRLLFDELLSVPYLSLVVVGVPQESGSLQMAWISGEMRSKMKVDRQKGRMSPGNTS